MGAIQVVFKGRGGGRTIGELGDPFKSFLRVGVEAGL